MIFCGAFAVYYFKQCGFLLQPLICFKFIIFIGMNRNSIKRTLQQINLNFDIQTIRQVQDFLIEQIGDITDDDDKYQIYAAAAIISQLKTLPNVYNTGFSKSGIHIENIMSHLQKLSKEEFLQNINHLLNKMKRSPQKLRTKVEDVKYSYRFYMKFTATFNEMFKASGLQNILKNDLCSTFWILYLFIKNSVVQSENIQEVKNLLIVLFRSTFEKFVPRLNVQTVSRILVQHLGVIPQISLQKYEAYYIQFNNKLEEVYNIRMSENFVFQKIATDSNLLARFLDDMSTLYQKSHDNLQLVHYIDELSYLELKKTLTPLVIKKNPVNCPAITKRLNLDDDSDDSMQQQLQTPKKAPIVSDQINESTPKIGWLRPLPQQFRLQNRLNESVSATPISLKIQNEQFIKGSIELGTKLSQQTKILFQKYQKKDYSEFQMQMMEIIQKTINQFDSRCKTVELRKSETYAFFMYVLSKIDKNYSSQEEKQFFKDEQMFESLLCLCTKLFKFALRAIKSQYKSYCDIFKLSLTVAFKPITLIQKSLNYQMPKSLLQYLNNIEKQLVIKQIWQDNTGFQIINGKNSHQRTAYTDLMARNYKKIQCHSKQRVKQICKKLKIGQKITSKIINLLAIILKQKYYLLKKNNIDQIILCCIMSCLSINQKEEEQTLQMIFAQYIRGIQMSYNSNQHGLHDNMGNSMGIVEYYNQIFLNEMRQILNNVQQGHSNVDIFLTPIRIEIRQNSNNMFKNMGSLKQTQSFGKLNPQTVLTKKKISYLTSLLKNSQMKQQKDEQDEQPPSPTFGPPSLVKKLTFGKQP